MLRKATIMLNVEYDDRELDPAAICKGVKELVGSGEPGTYFGEFMTFRSGECNYSAGNLLYVVTETREGYAGVDCFLTSEEEPLSAIVGYYEDNRNFDFEIDNITIVDPPGDLINLDALKSGIEDEQG